MTLVWYVTDKPFLAFPSAINSLDLEAEPYRPLVVGEKWGAPRRYNGLWKIEGLVGDHYCGPREWFEEGQPWPYTGPDVEYDADHIPKCCPRAAVPELLGGGAVGATVPVPADGCNCGTAFPVAYPSSQVLPPCLSTAHVWVAFDWPPGTAGTFSAFAFGDIKMFRGDSCAGLVQIDFGIEYMVHSFTTSDGGRYYVDLVSGIDPVFVQLS